MIHHLRGDLFAVTHGILAHACNCHGSWGGGIALTFKAKFPHAYQLYREHCQQHTPEELLGTCYMIPEGKYTIACLFTNDGHTADEIASFTRDAVKDMFDQLDPPYPEVSMPHINAGIFGVPWEKTEAALKTFNHDIKVYAL